MSFFFNVKNNWGIDIQTHLQPHYIFVPYYHLCPCGTLLQKRVESLDMIPTIAANG